MILCSDFFSWIFSSPTKIKGKGGSDVLLQDVYPVQKSYCREERTRYLLLFCVHVHALDLLCSSNAALTRSFNLNHAVTFFTSISG